MAYRELEIDDNVKIINPGFNNHGCVGVVEELVYPLVQVKYVMWESHGLTEKHDLFMSDQLLVANQSITQHILNYEGYDGVGPEEDNDFSFEDEKLYEGNLLERILKLEQEVLDLKKQLLYSSITQTGESND